MPVLETTVAEGKCYKTPKNQLRRVIGVAEGKVTYQSWGGKRGYQRGQLTENTAQIGRFAKAVQEEISCPPNLPKL
jgi:hypothetical protein